jgi:16S rRNA (guanine527-N7)-methyltransferase
MKPRNWPEGLPPVSHETLERLYLYESLLHKWQSKINLVSPATLAEAWERHFIDSAQLSPFLEGVSTLYDLGSGAGFAGMVLAIFNPATVVTLIESDSKKCAFLQTVSRETGVPVAIRNERIEAATAALPAPHAVTARALADLSNLCDYVAPWAVQNSALRLIFPKGAQYAQEIKAAHRGGWEFDVREKPSLTAPESRILILENLHKAVKQA